MQPIELAINEPFAAPPAGAGWVIFSEGHAYTPEENIPAMLSRAVRYARKYGVYLIPGKFLQNGRLCMCLISPEGEPLLGQEAIFLNLGHRGELMRGESISIADTPFGRVALCVDVDLCHPEYIGAAAGLGAQIIFSSRYVELFDAIENRIKAPVRSAALTGGLYVVSVSNAGSCIAGPDGRMILSIRESLSRTASLDAGDIVRDSLKIAAGRRLMDGYFAALNTEKDKEADSHA